MASSNKLPYCLSTFPLLTSRLCVFIVAKIKIFKQASLLKNSATDDDIRPWLHGVVATIGASRVSELLLGVGELEITNHTKKLKAKMK
jgi:hypothetical protein